MGIRPHQSALKLTTGPSGTETGDASETLENTRPGAVLHRAASNCTKLPRQDLNLNKESQNPIAPHVNSLPFLDLSEATLAGRSAGRSDVASEEGNIDPELAALLAAWPTLPAPIRAAIRALVHVS